MAYELTPLSIDALLDYIEEGVGELEETDSSLDLDYVLQGIEFEEGEQGILERYARDYYAGLQETPQERAWNRAADTAFKKAFPIVVLGSFFVGYGIAYKFIPAQSSLIHNKPVVSVVVGVVSCLAATLYELATRKVTGFFLRRDGIEEPLRIQFDAEALRQRTYNELRKLNTERDVELEY
jgi:hypothetical protein